MPLSVKSLQWPSRNRNVVNNVQSQDQQHQLHLGIVRNANTQSPPDLLNQKQWGWSQVICVLTSPSHDSDVLEVLFNLLHVMSILSQVSTRGQLLFF